ncbi:TrbG/VirB9 family P-type conjugative transfer protein [Caulobacter hibisci]|uniref:TrbG/VirB9 family P-type conjugative transfer protein n=1 Tax=Caulobacter hibisci TaxID=2035993 RepID=A0ABS0SVZ4_9CAUL|nr:TrbG/VirB9 family P-type conjugative transfer protein [Caulobacter hibisci]MBI1682858.1 TrbG/VirB9 family P-type conjugative transfer protein [Caulobacter hibisci]
MRTLLPALLAALAPLAAAQADSRIRFVDYDDAVVVRVDGCFGFQTMIEFAPGERIENVGLGDAAQWLVAPNKRADMLFVKPAYRTSHSNMTVSTDKRRYSFELVARPTAACAKGQVVYDLRFRYAADPAADLAGAAPAPPVATEPAMPPPEQRNAAYTFTGAAETVPMRVFDNGQATFFRWSEGTTTPAVYAVAADKSESLVSFTSQGDWLVASQVAPAFVLRRGNAVAVLHNDAYQTPALDAASPQPRAEPAQKRSRLALFSSRKDKSDVR